MNASERTIRVLDAEGAVGYITDRLGISPDLISATYLGGGISNHVVLVQTPADRIVLKQSLPKLRVQEDWFADRSRIFREADALRSLRPLLPAGSAPAIIFEDREQYAFAMEAAPAAAVMWKTDLMAGDVDVRVAKVVGDIHAAMLNASWNSETWRRDFGDQTAFDQLRLDPYYRFTARRHPDLAAEFEAVIDRCRTEARSLVHGDWSPKNLLVDGDRVIVIDFEVIHFGDPAFDAGFLINHLILKRFYNPKFASRYIEAASVYWNSIKSQIAEWRWLESGTLLHVPLLLLARIDGKSPVEYVREPVLKDRIRAFARSLIADKPGSVEEVLRRIG